MARVSELGPGQGSNPFGFLGDLMKMISSDGPINVQIARQAALTIATGGQTEPNVDPLDRLRLEELLRVADLHVSDATGLSTAQAGGIVSVRAVTRAEWSHFTFDHYKPLFERLAAALTAEQTPSEPLDPDLGLLGTLPQLLGSVFLGAQAGTLCGHLALQAMGQYDLPIPRPLSDELLMVPATIARFAEDWTLPPDDVRLWVCLSELAHHAVLGRPHVRERLDELLGDYVRGFKIDPSAIGAQLDQLDLSNPSALPELFGNPEALLGAISTPEQEQAEAQLGALVSAIEGYVDHVVDTVGSRLIGSHAPLTEALRRRRADASDASDADQLMHSLFGLDLSRAAYERGGAFVGGVVERAGEEGLARLWAGARELPTPAEVDAPGLWLARIDLPD